MWSLHNKRCRSRTRLERKTALVTDCSTDIGKETVIDFYKRGAKVIMACSDIRVALDTKSEIENVCRKYKDVGELLLILCDLSSFESTRECALRILKKEPQLNILVNCADVTLHAKCVTADGHEMHFGTNHLGQFLLTLLLLPRLRQSAPARIVTVSSVAHFRIVDFEDLRYTHLPYIATDAYARSKLANVLFSSELAARLKENEINNVNTYSLHPGPIEKELNKYFFESLSWRLRCAVGSISRIFRNSNTQGAQTIIHCAVDEKCSNQSGLHYSNCIVTNPSVFAFNAATARGLWDISVEFVGLKDYDPFTTLNSGT